jgi:hypothetical protein
LPPKRRFKRRPSFDLESPHEAQFQKKMSGMNINPKQAAVATASAEPVTTIGAIFSNSPGMPRVFKTNFDYQLVRTMCTGARRRPLASSNRLVARLDLDQWCGS